MKKKKVRDAPGASSLLAISEHADREESALPTPEATNKSPDAVEIISDGNDGEPTRPSQRMSSRKRMKQKKLQFDSSPPSASKHSINLGPPLRARSKKSSQPNPKAGFFGTQKTINVDSSEDEEEVEKRNISSDDEPALSQKLASPSSKKKRKRSPSPEHDVEPSVEHISDGESEDDDVIPVTPAARRRQRPQEIPDQDNNGGNSSPLLLNDEEDDSDVVVTGSRTRGKRKALSEDEDDSPVVAPRSRKRLRRLNPISEEEQQDLEDDLRDLASSGTETEIRPSQKKKKNAREEALARLKRKRGGAIIDESDVQEPDEEEEDDGLLGEPYEEEENMIGFDEEDDLAILPPKLARKQMFSLDDDDEGFVVEEEEDDALLGVPDNIPIEYTRYASMKAKDLFKFAIDWMVQKKINPAFPMQDEIYGLTFRKLDDEVKGLAGSKFVSSAWTPEFTFTLEARPEIECGRIDRGSAEHFLRDKCDACNRSGHPATYEVMFRGRPYDRDSLETVAASKDSDSDSEGSDSESEGAEGDVIYDSKSRPIAPSDKVFYLGKFCMSNAQTAHSLSHWKWHLYEWVVDYLGQAGYTAPEKIVKRDKWSTRKRRKYGNKIVDAMQHDGKIKELYRDFKNEIDAARNAKVGRFDSSP